MCRRSSRRLHLKLHHLRIGVFNRKANLRRKRASNHVVVAVFYHVDPSDVKHEKGSFGEAFARHEEKFKAGKMGFEKEWMERMKGWKEALKKSCRSGRNVLENQADG
ncbi:hypothetical protein RJ640_007397 [Escallonia rubra]|uniref:TIR domain-containing protein n=1 Tax=Escallonia rubra TaxID=112253 RepID=A0AA88QRK9_9ASTE|nr:hypothetical protein RJ640_007397 [Escallonia rubra]